MRRLQRMHIALASHYKNITQGKQFSFDLPRTVGELPLVEMKAIWCIAVVLAVIFIQDINAQGMNLQV